ncbi:Transmembrane protein 181 [Cricetulus griseus]|uniref:Transmembrane protein 181 n=1 Tax=Cricetulus griseus TaxID=10029 RepID=G3HWC8_CRIGR|nr:Transmembrane protein 181 [Cricetulus griseus]
MATKDRGLKQLCQRLQEAYRELKEDLAPFKDDRYYRILSREASLKRTGLSSLLGSSLMFWSPKPAA